jgi:hypothetical protein
MNKKDKLILETVSLWLMLMIVQNVILIAFSDMISPETRYLVGILSSIIIGYGIGRYYANRKRDL